MRACAVPSPATEQPACAAHLTMLQTLTHISLCIILVAGAEVSVPLFTVYINVLLPVIFKGGTYVKSEVVPV